MHIQPGDMLLEVNGIPVKHFDKDDVTELLSKCRSSVHLVLIAGAVAVNNNDLPRKDQRLQKAKYFHKQVNNILITTTSGKTHFSGCNLRLPSI